MFTPNSQNTQSTTSDIESMLENLNIAQVIVRNDMSEQQQQELLNMLQNTLSFINQHGRLV